MLAYFDRPGTSNGPTEAINGRLEHLRGSALDFRNLTNYIARSLLETGGFRPRLHPRLRRACFPAWRCRRRAALKSRSRIHSHGEAPEIPSNHRHGIKRPQNASSGP
ncbi:hypothetical protein GCM10027612_54040 [Microbispora bryophytorum subsp. camponoti]